ncbi:MAG TPA: hypothetical protein VEZ41_08030 [Allosphingosinicella sp.]|jgi:hypothetical protein|nr:hypothetical protein [Allosphingosinicella sp.]
MDWGIVVLLIVMIGALTSTIQTVITARGSRTAAVPGKLENASQQEILALKERVAVLERIATERSHSLSLEIERLRDR